MCAAESSAQIMLETHNPIIMNDTVTITIVVVSYDLLSRYYPPLHHQPTDFSHVSNSSAPQAVPPDFPCCLTSRTQGNKLHLGNTNSTDLLLRLGATGEDPHG